jgi:hypothetical protein
MTRVAITDQISLAGFRDRENEDRAGVAGAHAWVIDGATGLGLPFMGAGSDAAWLAQQAHESITKRAPDTDAETLLGWLANDLIHAFGRDRTRAVRDAWELPCGAFLLASGEEGGVRLSWNGDCRVLVQPAQGPLLTFGATPLSEEAEADLVRRLGQGGDPARRYAAPEALAALRLGRAMTLQPGASLIMSPDTGFLKHVATSFVAGSDIDLLLMTDGFAAAELRYGLFATPAELMRVAREEGLAVIGQALRQFERETDPDGVLKPRWKRSDDATALLVRISS